MSKLVEMAKEVGLEVRNPDEMLEHAPQKSYASALVHFLDRDSQLTKAMTYPITRIELQQMNDARDGIDTVRTFVVDDNGKWKEVQ